MAMCAQASCGFWVGVYCFIYNFQTLLAGLVALAALIPVRRQLKDTNLQTRISHRETLANLLRAALRRYERVDKEIREPLNAVNRVVYDPEGESEEIGTEDAHGLEGMFRRVLDWYLVGLADTEHGDIEARKGELKVALDRLVETLGEAHWADINEQHDEFHDIPDDKWAELVARCAAAKTEATDRVGEVDAAYRGLQAAQRQWVQSLRTQIAKLDLQIAGTQR
jgi:hypothetical protein